MNRATGAAAPIEPTKAVCVAMHNADLIPAYAFVFRVTATETRFTLYTSAEDRYRIGEEYTLLLNPAEVVPLALTLADAQFLRHCLHNAAHRWREAIAEADAAATQPQQARAPESGCLDVEPTRAGYHAARRLFADELDRVRRLTDLIDRHVDHARSGDADGSQP